MTDVVAPRVDGRTARAERTRNAIVEAHLALIGEGDLKPTGERIAERAGVSLRALWANFKDMEALFRASGERLSERQDAEFRPVPPTLPLARRIDEFCRQRARILELIAPSARAAQLLEPFSAQLRQNRASNINRVQGEIKELFAQELDAAGPARDQLFHAVTVASTWAAWSMMRDELHLEIEEATGVMVRTMTALLATAFTAGLR
jgi:TetR/AcrR family transcriptional regulator, regulator of autoinduction and epiphytic fitness